MSEHQKRRRPPPKPRRARANATRKKKLTHVRRAHQLAAHLHKAQRARHARHLLQRQLDAHVALTTMAITPAATGTAAGTAAPAAPAAVPLASVAPRRPAPVPQQGAQMHPIAPRLQRVPHDLQVAHDVARRVEEEAGGDRVESGPHAGRRVDLLKVARAH